MNCVLNVLSCQTAASLASGGNVWSDKRIATAFHSYSVVERTDIIESLDIHQNNDHQEKAFESIQKKIYRKFCFEYIQSFLNLSFGRSRCLNRICSFLLIDKKQIGLFHFYRCWNSSGRYGTALRCGLWTILNRSNGAMAMYACILHRGINANRLCSFSRFIFTYLLEFGLLSWLGVCCVYVCVVKICKFLAVNSPRPAVEFTHMCFARSHIDKYIHAADMRHIEQRRSETNRFNRRTSKIAVCACAGLRTRSSIMNTKRTHTLAIFSRFVFSLLLFFFFLICALSLVAVGAFRRDEDHMNQTRQTAHRAKMKVGESGKWATMGFATSRDVKKM